jgi:hypothetical protein
LGAGELLDRAVTLFVRDFLPIVIVIAVVIVPVFIFQAIVAPKAGHVFTDVGRVFSSMGNKGATESAAEALTRDSGSNGLTFLLFAVSSIGRLLMWSAVIGLVTIVPLVIAYVLLLLLVGVFAAVNQPIAAAVVGVAGGLIVLSGFAVVLSLVFMIYQLASVAVVTETPNPIEAVGTALRRGLARGMRRRTIVGGLVVFVVSEVGALPLVAVAATVTALTHVDVLYFAILGVGTVLLEGIVAAFVVVYAVDVRIRREGFDIIAAEPPPVLQ